MQIEFPVWKELFCPLVCDENSEYVSCEGEYPWGTDNHKYEEGEECYRSSVNIDLSGSDIAGAEIDRVTRRALRSDGSVKVGSKQ